MAFHIGAHINREKTLIETMEKIKVNNGNALQIFASNPRSAALVNIEKYTHISEQVKQFTKSNNFKLVIHSPYTINIAKELKNGKKVISISDCYWVQLLLHELHISHLLGSVGVVLHVGKHTTLSYEDGLNNMKNAIKYIINEMDKRKYNTKLIIETPAGQGTELLKDLKNFTEFFDEFTKDEKKYLGICLDTAHVWSAGYELEEAFKILFTKHANYLSVVHYNNSEREFKSMVDKHAPIFYGQIPNKSMKDFLELLKSHKNKPVIILETPSNNYGKEIEWVSNILNS